jgi:hypothetical protein
MRNRFYKSDTIDNRLNISKQRDHITPEQKRSGSIEGKKAVKIDSNTVVYVDQDADEEYIRMKYGFNTGQI